MIDWAFISELEGVSRVGYVPRDDDGLPIAASGVTIVSGIDLGQHTVAEIEGWKIPRDLCDRLTPYAECRGMPALDLLRQHPLEVSIAEAGMLSEVVQKSELAKVRANYLRDAGIDFDRLPDAAQTIIVSVAWQYGPGLKTRTPNFWRLACAQDWRGMIRELRAFGDAYPTRRRREAQYLEQALGGG